MNLHQIVMTSKSRILTVVRDKGSCELECIAFADGPQYHHDCVRKYFAISRTFYCTCGIDRCGHNTKTTGNYYYFDASEDYSDSFTCPDCREKNHEPA